MSIQSNRENIISFTKVAKFDFFVKNVIRKNLGQIKPYFLKEEEVFLRTNHFLKICQF